jgi:cobalamin biosynthesis Mg chelatase CobN
VLIIFSTTLLTPRQLHLLTAKHHFHLLPDGCFSLGCLNSQKLDLLARAIDAVVRESLVQEEEEEEEALLEEAESDAAHNDLQQRLEAAAKAAAEAEADAAAEATIEVTPDLAEEVDDLQERLAAAAKAAAAAEASAAAAAVVAATRHSSEETQTGHQITEEDFDMLDADGESLDGDGMVRQKTNSNYDGDEPPGAPETDFSGLAEMAMRSAQNMAGDEQENEEESEEAQRVARAQLLQLMT